jgi:hypothetical protein
MRASRRCAIKAMTVGVKHKGSGLNYLLRESEEVVGEVVGNADVVDCGIARHYLNKKGKKTRHRTKHADVETVKGLDNRSIC